MIVEFAHAFVERREEVRAKFAAGHPNGYSEVVCIAIEAINPDSKYELPDPERIHRVDDGDYQGTFVYVIGAHGYQPHQYWAVKVAYGSCSACDTFQRIRYDYADEWDAFPNDKQVEGYMSLALHIVQGLKEI